MAVVTLDEAKAHLRVDHDAEDELIGTYLAAATQSAADFIHRPIPWTDEVGEPVEVPGPVKAAILLILGDLYAHREGRFVGTTQTDNPAVQMLLWPYRMQGFY